MIRLGSDECKPDAVAGYALRCGAVYLLRVSASRDPHRSCEVDHDVNSRWLQQLALLLAAPRARHALSVGRYAARRRSVGALNVAVRRLLEQASPAWNKVTTVRSDDDKYHSRQRRRRRPATADSLVLSRYA